MEVVTCREDGRPSVGALCDEKQDVYDDFVGEAKEWRV